MHDMLLLQLQNAHQVLLTHQALNTPPSLLLLLLLLLAGILLLQGALQAILPCAHDLSGGVTFIAAL